MSIKNFIIRLFEKEIISCTDKDIDPMMGASLYKLIKAKEGYFFHKKIFIIQHIHLGYYKCECGILDEKKFTDFSLEQAISEFKKYLKNHIGKNYLSKLDWERGKEYFVN